MQILAAKLAQRNREERQAEIDAIGGNRTDNAWGSQIRSYTLAPYQLVKDVRTRVETGNVDAVLDGDLDMFIEAELRRRRVTRLTARPSRHRSLSHNRQPRPSSGRWRSRRNSQVTAVDASRTLGCDRVPRSS